MRKIEHIEKQIQELPAGEFGELRDWILERDWKSWDSQIEADTKSGEPDRVLAEARAGYASGRTEEI